MRFSAEMDALLRVAGEMAMIDGLNAGGFSAAFGSLPQQFRPQFNQALADQQEHVLSFALAVVNAQDDSARLQIANRQNLWLNKGLMEFYYLGLLLARSTQRLKWVLGPTEHCTTCLGASDQVHTAQEWLNLGLFPRSSRLECGGYECQCDLVITQEPVSGTLAGTDLQPGLTYQSAPRSLVDRLLGRLF